MWGLTAFKLKSFANDHRRSKLRSRGYIMVKIMFTRHSRHQFKAVLLVFLLVASPFNEAQTVRRQCFLKKVLCATINCILPFCGLFSSRRRNLLTRRARLRSKIGRRGRFEASMESSFPWLSTRSLAVCGSGRERLRFRRFRRQHDRAVEIDAAVDST